MNKARAVARFLIDLIIVIGPPMLRDAAGLVGVGLVSYGAWLVYEPAGYIAGGILLLAGALLSARGAG